MGGGSENGERRPGLHKSLLPARNLFADDERKSGLSRLRSVPVVVPAWRRRHGSLAIRAVIAKNQFWPASGLRLPSGIRPVAPKSSSFRVARDSATPPSDASEIGTTPATRDGRVCLTQTECEDWGRVQRVGVVALSPADRLIRDRLGSISRSDHDQPVSKPESGRSRGLVSVTLPRNGVGGSVVRAQSESPDTRKSGRSTL